MTDTTNRKDNWIGQSSKSYCCKFEGPGPSAKTNINLNIGIIDILQEYNIQKQIEYSLKNKSYNLKNKTTNLEISSINSKNYKKRFDTLIDSIIHNLSSTKKKSLTRKNN